jgi:hypothetical protein
MVCPLGCVSESPVKSEALSPWTYSCWSLKSSLSPSAAPSSSILSSAPAGLHYSSSLDCEDVVATVDELILVNSACGLNDVRVAFHRS